eukprot:CAMPEP_0197074188 /NCGR_PEP_ID=MMETSP1384-20130603/210983_1 /TAXON_ID=29189 /ORGANISM="Ammonia sp." /LENGTH=467 /DNA_ID=CAMNT_0042513029 /DNA_START=86 /DNA_END=1489 /DNA_ORIENTATION=+
MQYEPLRIYHEHQSSQLCARHCLNNLLQGPYFTEFDLSKIALDLDKEEQALLAQDGDENNGLVEWLKHNQQSQNVSDDGNFSIQVLRRALDNLGLSIIHLGHKDVVEAQQHPEKETGFICNLQAHWFAVRRIGGQWYNLNSLSGLPETKAKPTTISNFYLSAFLSTLQNDGYSIFVVRSDNWPHLHSYDAHQLLPPYAKWYLATEIKDRSETYPKELLDQVNKSRNGLHVTGLGAWAGNNQPAQVDLSQMTQEEMLQYAMMQSVNANHNHNTNQFGGDNLHGLANQDPELAEALAMSMSAYNNGNDADNSNNSTQNKKEEADGHVEMDVDDEDALLQQALAMSMEQEAQKKEENEEETEIKKNEAEQAAKSEIVDEPDESDADCCSIVFRMPQNKRLERRFKKQHTLQCVADYVKSEDASFKNVIFVCPPMNSYDDMEMTLETICKELNSKKLSFIVKENANSDADQ